jgi:orotidine-5'-phosphate decarboxylase
VLINVSRTIARAEKPAQAAAEIRDQILGIREHIIRKKE